MFKKSKEDEEFENKLEMMLEQGVNEALRMQAFRSLEKETDYSKQASEIETKIKNLVNNEEIENLFSDYKYALTQHILTINEIQNQKEFSKGLKFGKILGQNKKRNKKKLKD